VIADTWSAGRAVRHDEAQGPPGGAARDAGLAWEELRQRLTRFVERRIADPDDAEDVVQDVLVRIDRAIDTVDDATPLAAWVYRVARNAVIDYYRSARRWRERVAETLPDVPDLAVEPDPTDVPVRQELAACLNPFLNSLEPKYREALVLTDLRGMTQADAAALAGLSLPGMKSRVQRARKMLAALYHQHCDIAVDGRNAPIDCDFRSPGP
jgi:RNA polymerase sigma-70 factor, ECF subfamily